MADTLFAVRRADLRDPADLRDYLAMLASARIGERRLGDLVARALTPARR